MIQNVKILDQYLTSDKAALSVAGDLALARELVIKGALTIEELQAAESKLVDIISNQVNENNTNKIITGISAPNENSEVFAVFNVLDMKEDGIIYKVVDMNVEENTVSIQPIKELVDEYKL